MTNHQVRAARRALMLNANLVKVDIDQNGDTYTITPYLIANPSTRGTPVDVIANITPEGEISRNLADSIGALLG